MPCSECFTSLITRRAGRVVVALASTLLAAACASTPAAAPSAPQLTAVPPAVPATSPLTLRRPTVEEEFNYLFGVLLKMSFFRAHGYHLSLPKHPAFQAASEPGGELTPNDWNRFEKIFREEVYRASDYDVGLAALSPAPALVEGSLRRLALLHERWGFRVYPNYTVVLTLYGPGGSYDTRTGTITLLARSHDGAPDVRASQTVVHEIVHMGIEDVIVQRFHLPHEVKERLVDRICITYLGDILAGYKAQPMGPAALDDYVDAHAVLDLPTAVQAFVQANKPKATVEEAR